MSDFYTGKAVITGASAGIGRVYADRLAARGFDLVLVARRGDRLEEVAASIRTEHMVRVETIIADLGSAEGLAKVTDAIADDPSISMLVNNAGTATMAPIGQTSIADADAMTVLNITALVRLTLTVLAGFKARNRGTIVNIGSVLGFHWLPISPIYSATKSYVEIFTRGLQDELADTGVTVQLIAPSAISTDLWEISGVPLSALDPKIVMTVDHLVDSALAGLDLDEAVTLPSVENATELLGAYDKARIALLGASQTGVPASRYAAEPAISVPA